MKKRILPITQTVINLALIPLFFINFIVGIGHLPDQNGNITQVRFYHSPFENLSDGGFGILIYITFSLILYSVLLSAACIMCKNKKS